MDRSPPPSTRSPDPPRPAGRRPAIAIGTYFFVNGAAYASWVPRLPDIKAKLHVTDSQLGLTLVGGVLGSLAMSLFFGPVIDRFGSRRATVVSSIGLAFMLPLVAVAPRAPLLFAALACFGCFDAFADVAVNTQGMQLQRRRIRSIMTRLHGTWSVGALVGGLVASRAASAGVGVRTQLVFSSIVLAGLAAVSSRGLLPSEHPQHDRDRLERSQRGSVPLRVKLLFVAAGAAAIVAEIPATEWSTLMIAQRFRAGAGTASLGFVGFASGMVVGRFVGDAVIDAFGPNRTRRYGALLNTIGFVFACTFPVLGVVVVALVLAGVGCSWLNPLVVRQASEVFHGPRGPTLCGVGARLGILVGSPLMGRLSDLTSRSTALLVIGGGSAAALAMLRLPGPVTAPLPPGPG